MFSCRPSFWLCERQYKAKKAITFANNDYNKAKKAITFANNDYKDLNINFIFSKFEFEL